MASFESQDLYQEVQNHYGAIARGDQPKGSAAIAQAFGYSLEHISELPDGSNLGLSCGNPLAIASLREGEVIIDLGCGAGFDIFAASKQVGPNGRAIGIDMNQDMLARARKNQATITDSSNISFIEANITHLPLEDSSVDCAISNCVINLVPAQDKAQVFLEMGRVLKSGGRLAVSDILTRKPLSENILKELSLYVGCISGASTPSLYTRYLEEAGFGDITIVDTESDLNVYNNNSTSQQDDTNSCCKPTNSCCTPSTTQIQTNGEVANSLPVSDLNEWAGSFKVFAIKK